MRIIFGSVQNEDLRPTHDKHLVLLIHPTVILKSVKGNSNQITSSNDRATDWESYVQVKAEGNVKEHLCLKWIVSRDRLYRCHIGSGVGNGFALDF